MSGFSPVDGEKGVLSLTFDNLGEAAELEAGAVVAEGGRHFTALAAVPEILDMLAERKLAATFFVEGLNAELYPGLLQEIAARGHEVAYHAWRHEQWRKLPAEAQEENLARGIAAFAGLGLAVAGFRPPGGDLGQGGTRVLREAGLRYCSPAGSGVGAEDEGLALLPFEWRHVDASCVLPDLGPPREPGQFVADLEADLERLGGNGGHLALVLHPFMLDWLGEERLAALFARLAEAARLGELWTAPCRAVAERVLADPESFAGGAPLSGP
jgi:peptidoglycan/xylan/chitin deacetylase (PgdA/CDA1 family)